MTFRVLTAEFAHETNTFSRLTTGKQAFEDRFVLMGDEAVAARCEANAELAGRIVHDAVERLPAERDCSCGETLAHAIITPPNRIPAQTLSRLEPILGRHVGGDKEPSS